LELRQGQGLVITPQLQQAIKLLQLSNIELEAFVEAELEKNPLLSRDDRDGPEPEAPDASREDDNGGDLSLDRVSDSRAESELDASREDLYDTASPGERATGDAGEPASEAFQAGGAVDWSRAGSGGTYDLETAWSPKRPWPTTCATSWPSPVSPVPNRPSPRS
jgi:RNA polymerase sigma-54 factor